MTGTMLNAMEAAAARKMDSYNRYGSSTMKQVYIYGSLDTGPTILRRRFGFTWNVGGWLLFNFLKRTDPGVAKRMRDRVRAEMTTTFASHYTAEISLQDALRPEMAAAYQKKSTGEKYLLVP